jgi:aldehyde:ferredoxin oxidoreductase
VPELCGYTGTVLRVDLTTGKVSKEPTDKYLDFIGGLGLGWKVMWDEVPAKVKPFDPENRIIFGVGPLTGTYAPTSGRTVVISKSPQTWPVEQTTRGSFGGHWGPELKFAGYDSLIIQGKAEKPVYILIRDDQVEIRDASHIWGKDTFEAQKIMREESGDERTKTLAIGPCGENLSRIGAIVSDTGNVNGQGGFGSVMGSKNLKGIAVRGTKGVKVAKTEEEVKDLIWYIRSLACDHQSVIPAHMEGAKASRWKAGPGVKWTGGDKVVEIGEVGPTELNKSGWRSHAGIAYAEGRLRDTHVKNQGCFGCIVNCFSFQRVPGMKRYGVPETGAMNCVQFWYVPKNGGKEATFLGKQLVDMLGINCWEIRHLLALVEWLYESKKMTEEELGLPMKNHFEGDGIEFVTAFCHAIAEKKGIGKYLAEGVPRAAEKLGVLDDILRGDAGPKVKYCAHGMGDHYNPQAYSVVTGLNWMMDNRDPNRHDQNGLVHWSGLPFETVQQVAKALYGSEKAVDPVGKLTPYHPAKGRYARFIDLHGVIKDSLTTCDWVFPVQTSPLKERNYVGDTSLEAKLFSAITGKETSEEELMKMAERCWNLHRAITVREWGTKDLRNKHDKLADWYFIYPKDKEPFTPGGRLDRQDYEVAKEDYYKQSGWDPKTGVPTRAKLEELGLKDVADELEKLKLLP